MHFIRLRKKDLFLVYWMLCHEECCFCHMIFLLKWSFIFCSLSYEYCELHRLICVCQSNCIFGINSTLSCCKILLYVFWIWFTSILLRILAFILIKDIGLQFISWGVFIYELETVSLLFFEDFMKKCINSFLNIW